MLKIYVENGIRYFRIRVTPGLLGNALVTGEMVIQDSIWAVKSLTLSVPKYHRAEYDVLEVSQTYQITDSSSRLDKMEFQYNAKYVCDKKSLKG
jgi:hypothetical protein